MAGVIRGFEKGPYIRMDMCDEEKGESRRTEGTGPAGAGHEAQKKDEGPGASASGRERFELRPPYWKKLKK